VGIALVLNGGGEPAGTSHGVTHGYHAETVQSSVTYCAYGTRLNGVGIGAVTLTQVLIDAMLARIPGSNFLARILAQWYFNTLNVDELCASGPPPFPVIEIGSLQWSAEQVLGVLKAIAWPYFCECVPGSPTAIPYPEPQPHEPVGWPPALTFPCSNSDLCAAVVQIQLALAAVSRNVSNINAMTTLLQRYSLPFSYIPGRAHPGITGGQTIPVQGLVGIKVILTGQDSATQTFTGLPTYISDLGWLSIVTTDGLIEEVRYTRQEQLWAPRSMPLATSVGIALREGVEVTVVELEPEP
jgi:hypothetical protein